MATTKPAAAAPAEKLTHWRSLLNLEYIGAYSLQPGEEKTVEIISVGKEEVKGTDGKSQQCTVAKLKGEKPFILNRTNCKTLAKIYGSQFIEHWKDKKIIVFAEPVKAFGEFVDALRIKPFEKILPALSPISPKWSGALAALKAGTVTMEAIEEKYSLTPEYKKLLTEESEKPA